MSSKEKAFIILTPGFAASETDTTCLPMQQQFVKTISKLYPGLAVIILSFQYPYYESCYKWFAATVYSFNGKNKGGLTRLLLRKKINAVLEKINKENHIIGLLSFWLNECAALGKEFGKRNGIPHYCWILGQDAKKENKYPERIYAQSNELIALSDFLQKEFEKNHDVKPFTVIPPGIELKYSNEQHRDIDLLAAGSLIPLKQFEIFIEIVCRLKQKFPEIKAMLIGNGPEKNKLEKRIAELNIQNNILLTGELSYVEVLSLMNRTKIFLHPSSYEGFSGVCMEALSEGAHVVSFCRAMKENIQQWHIVKNKEEMEQKALALLSEPLNHCPVVRFTVKDAVQKIMSLYQRQEDVSFSDETNNETAFSKTN